MSELKGTSIRTKITISLVGLCLFSLLVVSVIVGVQIHSTLTADAKKSLVKTVSQKAAEYQLIFNRLAQEAESVGVFSADLLQRDEPLVRLDKPLLMPWVGEGTGTGINNGYGSESLDQRLAPRIPKLQRIGKMLEGVVASNELIVLGFFSSPEGIFVANDDQAIEDIGNAEAWKPRTRPWFRDSIAARRTVWTKPYVDVNTKNLIVTVASPVYDAKKQLLGVVGFDVLLQTIKDDILKMDLEYDGYSLLVGNDGGALVTPEVDNRKTHWDSNYETKDLLHTPNATLNAIVRQMVKQNTGLGVYKEKGEGYKYLAYAPLEAIQASVGVVIEESAVVAPAYRILIGIAIVAAVIAVIAIIIGITLGNSIARPIVELTNIAEDISNGKAELSSLEVDRKDEIGLLTESLNRLIASLRIAMKLRKNE